jgi:hypothetical protein
MSAARESSDFSMAFKIRQPPLLLDNLSLSASLDQKYETNEILKKRLDQHCNHLKTLLDAKVDDFKNQLLAQMENDVQKAKREKILLEHLFRNIAQPAVGAQVNAQDSEETVQAPHRDTKSSPLNFQDETAGAVFQFDESIESSTQSLKIQKVPSILVDTSEETIPEEPNGPEVVVGSLPIKIPASLGRLSTNFPREEADENTFVAPHIFSLTQDIPEHTPSPRRRKYSIKNL